MTIIRPSVESVSWIAKAVDEDDYFAKRIVLCNMGLFLTLTSTGIPGSGRT